MGCFFVKKWKMGVVFCKKWKMGVLFVKKIGPFFNAGCFMYSIIIFDFTFYLFGGVWGAYAPKALPCLWAW